MGAASQLASAQAGCDAQLPGGSPRAEVWGEREGGSLLWRSTERQLLLPLGPDPPHPHPPHSGRRRPNEPSPFLEEAFGGELLRDLLSRADSERRAAPSGAAPRPQQWQGGWQGRQGGGWARGPQGRYQQQQQQQQISRHGGGGSRGSAGSGSSPRLPPQSGAAAAAPATPLSAAQRMQAKRSGRR